MVTYSDAPAGSGLGASSTLCVTMVQAFAELLSLPLGQYDVAFDAFRIERLELQMSGGRQDQYAATYGGFNFMEFFADNRVIINPLRLKPHIIAELESSLVLFYTGMSRDSAAIIAEQIDNLNSDSAGSLDAFHQLKQHAYAMKDTLMKGNISSFGRMLGTSWGAKKKTAELISNPIIERALSAALNAGAYAGKVSGAGGGGFIMFVVDPLARVRVIRALKQADGGVVMPCHFTSEGVQSWLV